MTKISFQKFIYPLWVQRQSKCQHHILRSVKYFSLPKTHFPVGKTGKYFSSRPGTASQSVGSMTPRLSTHDQDTLTIVMHPKNEKLNKTKRSVCENSLPINMLKEEMRNKFYKIVFLQTVHFIPLRQKWNLEPGRLDHTYKPCTPKWKQSFICFQSKNAGVTFC